MRHRLAALVLVAALPAASAAGCGGGEDAAPAPTREEFVSEANSICWSAEQDLTSAQLEFEQQHDGPDHVEDPRFVEQVLVPHYQRLADEIGELTPPAGDEEWIDAARATIERNLSEMGVEDLLRNVPEGWVQLVRWLQRNGSFPCGN